MSTSYTGLSTTSWQQTLGSQARITACTVTYTAASSATLSSIAITTQPTKRAYVAGETFSSTGAVVTATYSDASTKAVTATWTPSTALSAGANQTITASYTEGGVTKTATTTIDVYGVTMQVLDEDGNAIAAGGPGAPTRSGATITAAANAGNYVFKEWQVTNATAASTTTTPTTISSPEGAVTVTAVYYKPITITYKANTQVFTTQTYAHNGTLAFPASNPAGNDYSCSGKTFVGWVAEANKNYSHATTAPTYATAGGSVTTSATYYAVFADAAGSTIYKNIDFEDAVQTFTDWTFTNFVTMRTHSDVTAHGGSYFGTTDAKSSGSVRTSGKIAKPLSLSVWVTKQTTNTTSSTWKIEVSSNGSTWTEVASKSATSMTKGVWEEMTADLSSYTDVYVRLSYSGSTAVRNMDDLSLSCDGATYSNYATTCCTPLGAVSGTLSSSTPTSATLTWGNVTGAEKYQVKVVGSTSHNDWTDAVSGVTVTGLTCNTAYMAYLRAIDTNGTHCSVGPESTVAIPASSWTVTTTGITNATTSPAIPSTTCDGFSTTISAASGYELPTTITVTNAAHTWNSSTGALTVSNVTGNVEITITATVASYFSNGATVFIQAESSSAWNDNACVKAWFNNNDAGGAAQTTYWLFDATGGDAGKKLFATVVPAEGSLNQVTLQRFAEGCGSFWNDNGTLTKSSDGGSNTFRSTGSSTSNVAWNVSGITLSLYGDPDTWADVLATFADQGNGVWTATYNNYAPADAAGESQNFKIQTNYNGWIGNTGSNANAELTGMHVGSTYNITATLDVKDHSLVMGKTFVKGTVHFDLQDHGLAIADLTNVTAGGKISAPSPAPSATGYDFGGWYKEPECTNAWNFASDEVNETTTLYAKWTAQSYSVTSTLSNVTASPAIPASYTYTGSAANLSYTISPVSGYRLPTDITVSGTTYTWNAGTGILTLTGTITENVSISITGVQTHTVTWLSNGENYVSPVVYDHGTTLALPAATPGAPSSCSEKEFIGWTSDSEITSETGTEPTLITAGGAVNTDATYRAVFADVSGGGSEEYVKVTANGDITSDGRYLIVYETGGVAFDGSLATLDAANNTVEVTISSSAIAVTDDNRTTLANAEFTIDVTNKYIKSHSNKYINQSANANGLPDLSEAAAVSSISVDGDEDFVVTGTGGPTLRYNKASDQKRFRFYKSGQEAIQLYKYVAGTSYDNYITQCCDLKPVTNLEVSGTTASTVTLTWTAPSPTTGIDHLELRNASTDAKIGSNIAVGTTTVTVSELVECTEYSYYIASVGAACETASATVNARPYSGSKTVNYIYHDGATEDSQFTTDCDNPTITLPTPTWALHTFQGWYDAATGGNKLGDGGATYNPATSPVTLHAQWTETEFVLTQTVGSHITANHAGTSIKTSDIASSDLTLTYSISDNAYALPKTVTVSGGGIATWELGTNYTWELSADKHSATLTILQEQTISADVTVTVTEQARYTVTLDEHGSTTTQYYAADDNSFTWGDIANCGEKLFYGWTTDAVFTENNTTPPTCVLTKGTETINSTRTYYAIYADAVVPQNPGYEKVTTISAGTYLIATDKGSDDQVYTGKVVNQDYGGCAVVSVSTGVISTKPNDAVEVTIEMSGDNFYMYDGTHYLGYSGSSNDMDFDASKQGGNNNLWKINNNSKIESVNVSGRLLQCNTGSNPKRFACYTSSQTVAYLYKKQTTAWSNFTKSCALFDITINNITPDDGTVTTSPAAGSDAAGEGQTVTVTATPNSCKYLSALSYNDGSDDFDILSTRSFTMPDADVTITATFATKTVSAIAPNTNTHRALMQGSLFEGEQIRVTYNSGETEDLAWDDSRLAFSGCNTSTLGEQTVTVTYTGCGTTSTTYTVTVMDGVPVTFHDAGEVTVEKYDVDDPVEVEHKVGRYAATCDGWDFAGWSETEVADNSTTFTPVYNFSATTPKTLYAVYSKVGSTWLSAYDISEMRSGAKYVIVKNYSSGNQYALLNTVDASATNYLDGSQLSSDCENVRIENTTHDRFRLTVTPSASMIWQVKRKGSHWVIYSPDADKYLKITSNGYTQLTSSCEDEFILTTYSEDSQIDAESTNATGQHLSWHNSSPGYWNGYGSAAPKVYWMTNNEQFSSNPPCAPRSVIFHGNGGTVSDGENESSDLVITEANRGDGITTPTAAMDAADCNGNVWEFVGWLPAALARTQIPVLTTDLLNDGGGNKPHAIHADNEEYYAVYSNTGMPETKYGTITITKADVELGYSNTEKTIVTTVPGMGDYTLGYVDVGHQSNIGIQLQNGQGKIYNKTSLGKINSISFTHFDAGSLANLHVYVGDEEMSTTHLLDASELQHIDGSDTYTYYPAGKYSYFYIQNYNAFVEVRSISVDFGKGSTIYASTPDCKLRVTYKAAGEEDHVVEIGGDDSHDLPAYYPAAGCDGKDFIGWAEAGIASLQQTAPTIYTADGSLTGVSAPKTLYAVYASRNGGKVTGTHTLTEDFESYTANANYGNTDLTFNNANGLSWVIDYGNVTTTGASRFGATNVNNVVLCPHQRYMKEGAETCLKLQSRVEDLLEVSVWASKSNTNIYGRLYWSANGTSWSVENQKNLVLTNASGAFNTQQTFVTPQALYIKIWADDNDATQSSRYLHIDNITFTIADRAYYYTDYSTTCETATAPVTTTWAGIDGSTIVTGTEPENVSLGTWLTLPTLSKDNFRFDGWKVTINGDQKADVYLGGETFLINHPVTFTAQWTQVFESVVLPQNMPVVSANGVSAGSSVTGKVVINRADAAKPTAVLTGDNVGLFAVTVADGITDEGTTSFTYTVTYTPAVSNAAHAAQLKFKDGNGTGVTTGVSSSEVTVTGRSLPEYFVIAAQVGGEYLGLPENTTNSAMRMGYAVLDVAGGAAFNVENRLKYHVTSSSDSVLLLSSNVSDAENHRFAGFENGLRSAKSQNGANYRWYITYNTSTGTYRLRNTGVIDDGKSCALTYNGQSNVQKFGMIKEETVNSSYYRDLYLLPITEDTGYWLDIVDWNTSSLTINMNGRNLASGVDAKVGDGDKQTLTPNTRYSWEGGADRTYDVQTDSPVAGSYVRLHVEWGTKTGADVSERLYRMPYIYTGNTTLSDVGAITVADNIVVRSGRLTLNTNLTVRNVYVYPGAELVIASGMTLKAEKMYLRTEPFRTAALDDRGTLNVGQLYYTRIVADKDHAFMFGLPYDSKIEDMRLTTGQTMAYGTKWLLYTYDAARRAEYGASASGENWQTVSETVTHIEAKRAYDLLSGSAYYREYCFPVTYVKRGAGEAVEITDYTGAAATANPIHGGWNHFCSPYTRNYVQDFSGSPEDAVKLTELTEDKVTYWQHVPEVINPAIAYFYQTSADGTLTFGSSMLTFDGVSAIAARSHEQKVNTQWLVLNLTDKAGLKDETNFYLHPTKFNINYETKYDLEKMLGYAARPQLFSTMECGALSFNALPDSVAEEGVQLGYYAAAQGEYTFSLSDNKYMERLEEVWLVDEENGTQTDLLDSDYTFITTAGDNRTRFRLFVTFRREEPQTPTGDMQLQGGEDSSGVRKFVHKNRLLILRDGRLYDALGNSVCR